MAVITACQKKNQSEQNSVEEKLTEGTFGYDLAFLKKYKEDHCPPSAPDNSDAQAISRLPTIRAAL
jgi:hypothetical protein